MKHKFVLLLAIVALFGCFTGVFFLVKSGNLSDFLENNKIRYICDDCLKFVEREKRRGNKYDAIIMDPPSYGRGASGEVWQFEENIEELVELCTKVLSENPLFLLINSYTTGLSMTVLENILKLTLPKGNIEERLLKDEKTKTVKVSPKGLEAITKYKTLQSNEKYS